MRDEMRRNLIVALLIVACSVLCIPAAQADTLQFGGSSLSGAGTFTFPLGADQHLDISNALIGNLLSSAGICVTKCTVTGGYLNLDSGGQSGSSNGVYSFNAGGQLTIFGEIDSLGIKSVTQLLSASFLGGQTLQFNNTTGTFRGLLDPGTIVLNSSITSQSPVSGTDTESEFQVAFSNGTYSGKIASSTVAITTAAVPEPASILLLGSSLLSIGGIRRKWKM